MIKLSRIIVVGVISLLLVGSMYYTPKPVVVYLSKPAYTQLQDTQLSLDVTPRVIVPAEVTPQREVSRGADTLNEHMEIEVTAYTFTGDNTATGVPPRVGLVAVDPTVIPLGSKLWIGGYGYCTAADTGRDIKGYRIDVFFNTIRQCRQWGRRKHVHVEILD